MLQKEFENRKEDIKEAIQSLFDSNLTITEWDVPEVDENEAQKLLVEIFEEKIREIKKTLL
jgi:hypothetical protein